MMRDPSSHAGFMSSNLPTAPCRRRRLLGGLALGAVCTVLPIGALAQTTPVPAPAYGRRRRDLSSFLWGGAVLAGAFGWMVWSGKRKRRREEAAREMQARLARARERSKNL